MIIKIAANKTKVFYFYHRKTSFFKIVIYISTKICVVFNNLNLTITVISINCFDKLNINLLSFNK